MVDVRICIKETESKGVIYNNVILVFIDETGKELFKTQIKPSFNLTPKQYGRYYYCINEYIKGVK